jgi:multimeric flavodoxin WrbA
MRVVGLVSSPRRGGNSELAVKEIMSRLPDDWEKNMIRLNELDINYCRACYSCLPEGKKCVIDDDLDFLVRHIKHADKVIIAAPAYMLGEHTGIKRILDRLISIVSDHRIFGRPDCVIVNSYGMAEWEGMVREGTLLFAKKLHLNVIAQEVILATLPGDSVKGENLEKMAKLAELLINPPKEKGVYSSTHTDLIHCPFCSGTEMQIRPDGWVKCGVCGGEGRLVQGENGLTLEYDPKFIHRLTPEGLDIHTDYLIEKKQLFLDTKNEVKAIQARYADMDWWRKPEK